MKKLYRTSFIALSSFHCCKKFRNRLRDERVVKEFRSLSEVFRVNSLVRHLSVSMFKLFSEGVVLSLRRLSERSLLANVIL